MIDLRYPQVLDVLAPHLDPSRTESASFLIWYLEQYYRLDALEAVDSVCDNRGDKGVDGIYLNENAGTIDVFQTKLYQAENRTLGDSALREFRGTLAQFESQAALQNLVHTAGGAEVARLIHRLDLVKKLPDYRLRGFFVTNSNPDANAATFLATEPLIAVLGRNELQSTYISGARDRAATGTVQFDVSGIPVSEYVVDAQTKALIAPVKASDLVQMDGISDQSVFAFNVRGPLGRTQVNRDIVASIRDTSTHKRFPLFHNGITIISERVQSSEDSIEVENYNVVNGCQSLSALYDNRDAISGDLRVLVKFIQMDVDSALSEEVTRYSNNQNGVKPRDFKSNSPVQIRLQNEFKELYPGEFAFEIKRGELVGTGEVISNESAGLYLLSFDLGEPWATHRKYLLFDDKHADVFARPEVGADRILMLHLLITTVHANLLRLNNTLFGKYALTKFAVLYMLRNVFEEDETGRAFIEDPSLAVRVAGDRARFTSAVGSIVNDMIVDINAEVDEFGDDFDYRGKLRDAAWVKELSRSVVSSYLKLVQRGRISSLHQEWTREA